MIDAILVPMGWLEDVEDILLRMNTANADVLLTGLQEFRKLATAAIALSRRCGDAGE